VADDSLGALRRYARRVGDRWPPERAIAAPGGGEAAYLVVLVSAGFDGVPWLERVRQAESLWDAAEMGGPAEVHCYTPVELERKVEQLPAVGAAVQSGTDVLDHA
jgi:hypothetical protein